jgi:hypothetical protein
MTDVKWDPLGDEDVIPVAVVLLKFDQQSSFGWADGYIRSQYQTEHSGDCTHHPWTCSRCACDKFMGKARKLLAEMEASELGGDLTFVAMVDD